MSVFMLQKHFLRFQFWNHAHISNEFIICRIKNRKIVENLISLVVFSIQKQYVTEKMGGAEGTKLDLDFMDMERVSDSK